MQKHPSGNFHDIECALRYASNKTKKRNKAIAAKAHKEARTEQRVARERIKKRTGEGGHYDNLKIALHRYVKHVLRKGEPCYTCGKQQSFSDSPQSFHVGHFIPAGSVDPRRFMLEVLRIQCYSCNVPKSGMRAEYRIKMVEEMGLDHVEWLECDTNHQDLKERYPDIQDIKDEAAKYRRITKESGL